MTCHPFQTYLICVFVFMPSHSLPLFSGSPDSNGNQENNNYIEDVDPDVPDVIRYVV